MVRRDFDHSHDPIHRRAHIVAHTGNKLLLGGIGIVCRFTGRLKGQLFPHLFALALSYVLGGIHNGACLPLGICLRHHRSAANPAVFLRPCI